MRILSTICVALYAYLPSCNADSVVVTKPPGVKVGTPAALSAQLALTQVQLPFCDGVNDAIPVTFSYPLADDPSPESFLITVGNDTVVPKCATFAPADEANEKQTVLLLGQFQDDTLEPMQVEIRDVSFTVNGSRVPLEKVDDGFTVDLDAPPATLPVTRNQTLVDFAVLDLTAEDHRAEDDANGCAALFPASTYAVRLVFSSGVRDRDAQGALTPLGADSSAERANALFRLLSASGGASADEIIGQADADGDNIADVCVQGASAAPDAAVLVVKCADGAAVIAPDGAPCTIPIEVVLEGLPRGSEGRAAQEAAPDGASGAATPAPDSHGAPPPDSHGAPLRPILAWPAALIALLAQLVL